MDRSPPRYIDFALPPAAIGVLLVGIALVIAALLLRHKRGRFTTDVTACLILGILSLIGFGIMAFAPSVDVITKISSGSGDE